MLWCVNGQLSRTVPKIEVTTLAGNSASQGLMGSDSDFLEGKQLDTKIVNHIWRHARIPNHLQLGVQLLNRPVPAAAAARTMTPAMMSRASKPWSIAWGGSDSCRENHAPSEASLMLE